VSYKVLFLDVGNVIAPFDLMRLSRIVTDMMGYGADTYLLREAEGSALRVGLLTGKVSPDEFVQALSARFSVQIHPMRFWSSYVDFFMPNERLVNLCQVLRDLGLVERIIIASDADPHCLKHALHMTGIRPDAVVASYEVGCLKEDPEFFRHALKVASCPAKECLFIDDLPINIQRAREAEIEAVLFQYATVGLDAANDILIGELRHLLFR